MKVTTNENTLPRPLNFADTILLLFHIINVLCKLIIFYFPCCFLLDLFVSHLSELDVSEKKRSFTNLTENQCSS